MTQYYTEFQLWIDWEDASRDEIMAGLSDDDCNKIDVAVSRAGHEMVEQWNQNFDEQIDDIELHLSSDKSTLQMVINTTTKLAEDTYNTMIAMFDQCIGFDYYDDYKNIITLKVISEVYNKHPFSLQWETTIYCVDPNEPDWFKDDLLDNNWKWLASHLQNTRKA